jgi:hypothetical protein
LTKLLERAGDRLLSALLPQSRAAACEINPPDGTCVWQYEECYGSSCVNYYQCTLGGYHKCIVTYPGGGQSSWDGCC